MALSRQWLPRSVTSLRNYSARRFSHDLASGITVGLVALPLAMAFGIASGVTPQAGLYTAVVAGFLISALGGSRTQIGGPTGAFVVIVAGIVARFGVSGLALVTLMAGMMLLIMGVTGLGSAVQIHSAAGDHRVHQRHRVADRVDADQGFPGAPYRRDAQRISAAHEGARGAHCARVNWPAVGIAWRRWPHSALCRASRAYPGFHRCCAGLYTLLVALCTARRNHRHQFGGIPQGFPAFHLPAFHAEHILPLLPSAFTVALLAAIESLLSAVVADGMTGDRHNSNVELVAQGVANMVSPLFGGIPATGAIARTATNIRCGALTPCPA